MKVYFIVATGKGWEGLGGDEGSHGSEADPRTARCEACPRIILFWKAVLKQIFCRIKINLFI